MTDLSNPDAAGLPARRAALDLLTAALARRSGFDEAAATPAFRQLEPRDRGFARALVLATLRHLGPIDRALDAKLSRDPPDSVRNILRLGAAQAFVLGAPSYAAVSASVDLAASLKNGASFKGLVNAILRALTRETPDMTDPELLAPPWLFSRWSAAFGEDAARAMATLIPAEPATDLSLKWPAPDLVKALEAEELPGGTLRSALRGEISTWPGFSDGAWWVQDASAAIPARLLDVKEGETALDLCAAPGGKTLQLAAAGAEVTALDRSAARLVRVTENLARLELTAETVAADAGAWDDDRIFEAVLLDAPCSATGTYRRNPDVLWAARPGDVAALASVQAKLLDAAAGHVAPGGRLVYCVCSLEPEEGEAHTAGFLARNPAFVLVAVAPGEGGTPEASVRADGTLRILPHHLPGGTDGFFVARYARRA